MKRVDRGFILLSVELRAAVLFSALKLHPNLKNSWPFALNNCYLRFKIYVLIKTKSLIL